MRRLDGAPMLDGQDGLVVAERPAKLTGYLNETVLDVRHWTDTLFSFTTTRAPSFRFESGQFVMIGLPVDGRPLLRAYSIVSATYDEKLEFLSIKVPNGPLTSRLQHIEAGDTILMSRKPTGTLLLGNLLPGRRLYLLATGTGFAPFGAILSDPDVYERFDEVVLVYGCRTIDELAFATTKVMEIKGSEFLGDLAREKLRYLTTVTREPYYRQGRITDLIESGKLFAELAVQPLDPLDDRVMICGNPGMLADLRGKLTIRGFAEGNSGSPGSFVIERAFVEK
jgi:ferredoxin/flavodoxin---NADP+ reductase